MFVSTAYAQTAAPAGGSDMLVQFLPLILIFVVFYFLLIRPQQKKMKEHKAMLGNIRRGDRVVTGGGIIGTVTKVGADDELTVEIAENVRVRCVRSTVNLVLAKTEPAGKGGDGATPAAAEGEAKPAETPAAGGIGKLFGRK
ncbi:preprotein translocase subunit YajC [Azospirillum agricola]|uniref:preprotein translocase subunit YajC n=1 Tax=Azospirillum agricola TaxID=1720247 RepID=UPI000A0F08D9|nr:preprotein translocase subunit YajC [Azospirillum agricola]MBP2227291.1 preprotein translocase subunit YajC [Azospirillum agricola]SMH60094.1 protein translocase subunit yajC [Azospirillum lipoferum]